MVRVHLSVLYFSCIIFMLNFQFHFLELKFRLFYVFIGFLLTFFVSYINAEILIYLYTLPFLKFQLISNKLVLTNFIFTNLSEAFYCYILIALLFSGYITFFILVHSLFSYNKIGLFSSEKQFLYKFLKRLTIYINLVLILTSQFFLPIFLNFFLSFEKLILDNFFTIRYEAKLLEYIVLNNNFILLSITISLIPFFLFYLLELNFLSISILKTNRRIFILFFFILGAIFSPPDIYSQILIALPLSLCFELILFFSYLKKFYVSKFEGILSKKH